MIASNSKPGATTEQPHAAKWRAGTPQKRRVLSLENVTSWQTVSPLSVSLALKSTEEIISPWPVNVDKGSLRSARLQSFRQLPSLWHVTMASPRGCAASGRMREVGEELAYQEGRIVDMLVQSILRSMRRRYVPQLRTLVRITLT